MDDKNKAANKYPARSGRRRGYVLRCPTCMPTQGKNCIARCSLFGIQYVCLHDTPRCMPPVSRLTHPQHPAEVCLHEGSEELRHLHEKALVQTRSDTAPTELEPHRIKSFRTRSDRVIDQKPSSPRIRLSQEVVGETEKQGARGSECTRSSYVY